MSWSWSRCRSWSWSRCRSWSSIQRPCVHIFTACSALQHQLGLAGIGGVGSTCKDSVAIRLANLLTCGIGCRLLYGYHIRRELLCSGFRDVTDNAVWRADNSFTAGRTFNNQVVGVFIRIAVPQGVHHQFTVIAGVVTVYGDGFVVAHSSYSRCSKGYGAGVIQAGYSGIAGIVPSGTVSQLHGRSTCCQRHNTIQHRAISGNE